MHPNRRLLRVVKPRLQTRIIFTFLGISVLAMVLQCLVFANTVADTALSLAPQDAEFLMGELGPRLVLVMLISFGLLLPVTLLVGILVTQRFAGPLYRFEQYLKQVIAGEAKGECRLRKGDELQTLCDLINKATASVRTRSVASASASATAVLEQVPPALPSAAPQTAQTSASPSDSRTL